uniref:CUB domain-containing protein n=1 Tax=Macrostomum lignano TaxID=282301 RepID=A0A1I8FIG6_9PLAT
ASILPPSRRARTFTATTNSTPTVVRTVTVTASADMCTCHRVPGRMGSPLGQVHYGPPQLLAFSTAIIACRYVQANLGLWIRDVTRTLGGCSATRRLRQSCSTKAKLPMQLRRWRRFPNVYSLFSEDEDKTSRACDCRCRVCKSFLYFVIRVRCRHEDQQKLTIRGPFPPQWPTASRNGVISNNLLPEPLSAAAYITVATATSNRELQRACPRGCRFPFASTPEEQFTRCGTSSMGSYWKGNRQTGHSEHQLFSLHGTTRFSVELNLVNISYCHAEFHGVGGCTFTCASASSLSKRLSVFSIGPEFGSAPLALVTTDNQTDYRAFATPSNKFYVKLFTRALSLSFSYYPDSIVLDVELVKTGACPAGWLYRDGLCYGAAHPNNSRATFTQRCRWLPLPDVLGLASTTTWPTGQDTWVGVADTSKGVFFLDSDSFYYGVRVRNTCFGGNCRCVYFSAGSFYRNYCAQMLRYYLCSSRPGGDAKFYNLSTLDKSLGIGDASFTFNYYWIIGLAVAAALTGIGFGIRYLWYRRAVANSRSGAPVAANYAMTADGAAQPVAPAPANSHCTAPPGSYPTQPAGSYGLGAYSPGIGANEPGALVRGSSGLRCSAFDGVLRCCCPLAPIFSGDCPYGWRSSGSVCYGNPAKNDLVTFDQAFELCRMLQQANPRHRLYKHRHPGGSGWPIAGPTGVGVMEYSSKSTKLYFLNGESFYMPYRSSASYCLVVQQRANASLPPAARFYSSQLDSRFWPSVPRSKSRTNGQSISDSGRVDNPTANGYFRSAASGRFLVFGLVVAGLGHIGFRGIFRICRRSNDGSAASSLSCVSDRSQSIRRAPPAARIRDGRLLATTSALARSYPMQPPPPQSPTRTPCRHSRRRGASAPPYALLQQTPAYLA